MKVGTCDVCPIELRAGDVGAREARAVIAAVLAQVGTCQVAAAEVSGRWIGANQRSAAEVAEIEDTVGKVAPGEIGLDEVRAGKSECSKVCGEQVGGSECRATQLCADEVRAWPDDVREVRFVEARVNELRLAEVGA